MAYAPEGLSMRHAALGLVLTVGAIGIHGVETENPVVEQPATDENQAVPLSPDNLALIGGERDIPPRASRSRHTPTPTPPPAPEPTSTSLGSFESTCYNLRGTTASGKSAGYGRVAVDPRVIPLGTHLRIQGYGDAVAADTGGLIKGRIIDIWKPSAQACRNWGRRIVEVAILP